MYANTLVGALGPFLRVHTFPLAPTEYAHKYATACGRPCPYQSTHASKLCNLCVQLANAEIWQDKNLLLKPNGI